MPELKLPTMGPRIRLAITKTTGTSCSSPNILIEPVIGYGNKCDEEQKMVEGFYTSRLAPCILFLLTGFPLNRFAHLEDWQIHRNHHAANQCSEHHHNDWLHQAGYGFHGIINLGFKEICHFAKHGIK